jgi:hypothetical protein
VASNPANLLASTCAQATAAARSYARLEVEVRRAIETLTARVCPGCASLCCRVTYCREAALNPWYAFVNRTAGRFALPADWSTRRDPFGLGPSGCDIRAGRYVFCTSYTCRRLREALPAGGPREAFQELSDLLLPANRLPGGRLLHELRRPEDLGRDDVGSIATAVARASERLRSLVARADVPP